MHDNKQQSDALKKNCLLLYKKDEQQLSLRYNRAFRYVTRFAHYFVTLKAHCMHLMEVNAPEHSAVRHQPK